MLDEMRMISDWCFECPYSEMRGVFKKEGKDPDYDAMHKASQKSIRRLLTSYLGCSTVVETVVEDDSSSTVSDSICEEIPGKTVFAEPQDEKSDEEIWKEWEDEYEASRREWHTLRCPYLRKKNLEINIDREFQIPEDDCETLRLLDKMSNCYPRECKFNRTEHLSFRTVDGMMRVAIAKIDFALLERGKDFGRLMRQMYFSYYERANDIHECGYSWDLIRYYLNKFNIKLLSNEEYDALDETVQTKNYASKQEFIDALADGKCDKSGKLLVKKAEYTRYAAAKYGITLGYKEFWTRFDCIFSDDKGKPIPYKHFLQSFRDQEQ